MVETHKQDSYYDTEREEGTQTAGGESRETIQGNDSFQFYGFVRTSSLFLSHLIYPAVWLTVGAPL